MTNKLMKRKYTRRSISQAKPTPKKRGRKPKQKEILMVVGKQEEEYKLLKIKVGVKLVYKNKGKSSKLIFDH